MALNNKVPLEEEQIILARLILAQQIYFFSFTEYMDFRDFKKINPKLIKGFTKMFLFTFILVIGIIYGIVQFIMKASEDESLKPHVIIAMFSVTEFYEPPTQVFMYFWETETMVKLITQYMNTCRDLSDNLSEFYRSLTLKRKLFRYVIYLTVLLGLSYHIVKGSYCSDKDRRFVCGLFIPMWFPVETNYFPVKEIIEILSILVSFRLSVLATHHAIDTYVLAELFEYKCRNLIKLMRKTSLSREQNVEIVKQKFRDIIDYHQELNICFVLIRDILGGLSAPGITIFIPITATVSAAFMYMAEYLILMFGVFDKLFIPELRKDFNIAYFEEFIVLLGVCYMWINSMQKITDLGETIQEAAYDMNWYEMDRTMRKEYLIFLMNLQRPFEMQSMIFVLKKPMFLAMIRSIYSCVMLLLQMNNG